MPRKIQLNPNEIDERIKEGSLLSNVFRESLEIYVKQREKTATPDDIQNTGVHELASWALRIHSFHFFFQQSSFLDTINTQFKNDCC